MVRTVGGARGRGTSGVIVGRPLIPANVVPEDLISQCQVVLQGKSRNLIVRELQRTVRNEFGKVLLMEWSTYLSLTYICTLTYIQDKTEL